jgi:hypothetical protein
MVKVYSQKNILPEELIKKDSTNGRKSLLISIDGNALLNKDSLSFIKTMPKERMSKLVNSERFLIQSSIKQLKGVIEIDSNKTKRYIKNIQESLTQKNPVSVNKITFNSINSISSSPFSANNVYNSIYEFGGDVSIATIPLQFNSQKLNQLSFPGSNTINPSRINFDKDEYISSLKSKLKGKFNPDELLDNQTDILKTVKDQSIQLLKNDIESIKEKYSSLKQSDVAEVLQSQNLFEADISSIRKIALPEGYLEKVEFEKNLLNQFQDKINNGLPIDKNSYDSLLMRMEKYKGLEAIINKVFEHKNNWKKSGLIDKIAAFKNLHAEKLKQITNDPESIKTLALDKLQLNKIQKFFLKINKLNIGQNALTTGKLSINDLITKNISGEFLKKNKYVSIITGKQNTINSLNDLPFSDAINSTNNNIKAITYGKSDVNGSYRNLSLLGFSQNKSLNDIFQSYSASRSLMVGTISNRWSLGKNSFINAEISRSSMQYSNDISSTGGSYSSSSSKALRGLVNSKDIFNNMALSFAYQGELEDKDLYYNINAITVSNGYNNPASSYLNTGKQLDANVKKQFFKRRLQLTLRSSLRQYDYSFAGNSKLNSSYFVYDVKWKFSKANFFAFRYQPSRGIKIDDGFRLPVSRLDRISFELNLNKRLGSRYYRNYSNFAYQNSQLLFNDLNKSHSKTISLNNIQNITIGTHLLYWNNNFNFSANNSPLQFYLNSSVLSDLGITYTLLKTVSVSSSLNYNSVKAWYNQIGVRQTISGTIGNNLEMSLYVNVGKNINLYQPELYSPVRGDLSLKYSLEKLK